ncbi:MAG: hypothetical protein PWQ28_151 [Candidatus Woesearchaeota archaeon]|nr:hypothetical protein [Candidatus Woesearchaeota archaeon]MDK2908234.1 hypothetical protein [Candidatus Woesearchaeota archaeon]
MTYHCSFNVESEELNLDDVLQILVPEDKELTNKRGSYSVEKEDNQLIFSLEAKDATALRAMLNSIAKNLILIEKSWQI